MRFIFCIIATCLFGSLLSCSDTVTYAPVTDISTIERVPKNGQYIVQPGDTLYSIAWRYGLDYRYLANRNHIAAPFSIWVGERIYLKGKTTQPSITSPLLPEKRVARWQWPANGRVAGHFSSLNKGINIMSFYGAPVNASASGQVVYSGNGLKGYGNLIIIKHNTVFLTAYAYNSRVFVQEGDKVFAGQRIAAMGRNAAGESMLHFEIRRGGLPVNPLDYLIKE